MDINSVLKDVFNHENVISFLSDDADPSLID